MATITKVHGKDFRGLLLGLRGAAARFQGATTRCHSLHTSKNYKGSELNKFYITGLDRLIWGHLKHFFIKHVSVGHKSHLFTNFSSVNSVNLSK